MTIFNRLLIIFLTVLVLNLIYQYFKRNRTYKTSENNKKVRFEDKYSRDYEDKLSKDYDSLIDEIMKEPIEDYSDSIDDNKFGWDASFGVPLIKNSEMNKFRAAMQKNHSKFEKAFDNFNRNQEEMNANVTITNTIDPHKLDYRSEELVGKTMQEIYDSMIPKVVVNKDINPDNFNKIGNFNAYDKMGEYRSANIMDEF